MAKPPLHRTGPRGAGICGTYGQPSRALLPRADRGWRRLGALQGRSMLDLPDDPREWAAPMFEPSSELLDRALGGWERFLKASPAVPDE